MIPGRLGRFLVMLGQFWVLKPVRMATANLGIPFSGPNPPNGPQTDPNTPNRDVPYLPKPTVSTTKPTTNHDAHRFANHGARAPLSFPSPLLFLLLCLAKFLTKN